MCFPRKQFSRLFLLHRDTPKRYIIERMKCTTPEISWHNRDAVLSVDVQNNSCVNLKGESFWRVATGGADCHVVVTLHCHYRKLQMSQYLKKRPLHYLFFNQKLIRGRKSKYNLKKRIGIESIRKRYERMSV